MIFLCMIFCAEIIDVFSVDTTIRRKIDVFAPRTGVFSQNGEEAQIAMGTALQDFQLVYPDTTLERVFEDSQIDQSGESGIRE